MARKRSNLKLAEPKSGWSVDEAKIAELSKRIVGRALSPATLMDHVENHIIMTVQPDEIADAEALALRLIVTIRRSATSTARLILKTTISKYSLSKSSKE